MALPRAKHSLPLFEQKLHQHALFKPSRFEFELRIDQSLLLGGSLDCKENVCQLSKGMKASAISQRYAKAMQCELKQNDLEPTESKQNKKLQGKPIWYASQVQHCVLGKGLVMGDQAGSFTVEFDDRQTRVFSKETADRFFTVLEN